jgi:hypothetical protein
MSLNAAQNAFSESERLLFRVHLHRMVLRTGPFHGKRVCLPGHFAQFFQEMSS